jgi:hypothetical protein
MTTSRTLGIAVGQAFANDCAAQFSDRLGALLSSFVAKTRVVPQSQPVSGYYKEAADRVCASAPVTSLRQIAGGRR